ncbi:MAG: ATP-binding protein [Candidatus Thiodiazotropha endolucinida]
MNPDQYKSHHDSVEVKEEAEGGSGGIQEIPSETFMALDEDSEVAGGEWEMPEEFVGSIATTMFDSPASKDGSVTALLPQENIDEMSSQALVRIKSRGDGREYLGAVIEGPFAEPDGLRADATPIVVTTIKGGLLTPKYHGRAQIALIGEQLKDGTIVPPRRRPKPNSPAFLLSAEESANILNIRGSLRLGLAEGYEELPVCIPPEKKSVLPRHLAVLGTTGGGKSTTISGVIGKLQQAGTAVILVDTEGEYCAINEPTADPRMLGALKNYGLSPGGIDDTHVMHLVGRDTKNPSHPDVSSFALTFEQLSPYIVQEILDLNDAQQDRFFAAYDVARHTMDRLGIWPRKGNTTDDKRKLDWDEFEEGYPHLTLEFLYDVVRQITAIVAKDDDPYLQNNILQANQEKLKEIINSRKTIPSHKFSWFALVGKLNKIRKLKVFDVTGTPSLNYAQMLQPGRVSIIDLSDTESPQIRNLVISEMLRGIQQQQEVNYQAAMMSGTNPPPTMVFIEEAHEFLSVQRIKKMETLFQQVARIARRGRKRWLGLGFITQLPQHLPDEVLGLVNNWVFHKIADEGVINRLRKSVGGIDASLWRALPALAPGQAVVSFTSMYRPMQIAVDPTPCKLLMVE